MKIKTLIVAIAAVLIFLTAIIACLFLTLPEKMAAWTGLGPLDNSRLLTLCMSMITAFTLLGWLIEKGFEKAGRSGVQLAFKNNQRPVTQSDLPLTLDAEESAEKFTPELLIEHLTQRYGRRWKHKVRILLVQGDDTDIEHAVPGLCRDRWQEGNGMVLIHAGDAQMPPDAAFLDELKLVRPRRPLDGIVQVLNTHSLPSVAECDAYLRHRQKADRVLGWQAPVWLWLTDKSLWSQEGREAAATGALFGPGASPQEVLSSLEMLVPCLRQRGMAQILHDPRHDWFLRLSSRLQGELKARLSMLLTGLLQGATPYRLRGIMLSPELTAVDTDPHVRLSHPAWQTLEEDSQKVTAKKITVDGVKMLRFVLLALVICWGGGTALSLSVNRLQIYQAQETARLAADTQQPLAERLRNQLILQ